MKQYIVFTKVTENSSDFWIDRNIVGTYRTYAGTFDELIDGYIEHAKESGLDISASQRRRPEKMYRDTPSGPIQVGYCFKASTDIEFSNGWKKRYVTLWAEILECNNPF